MVINLKKSQLTMVYFFIYDAHNYLTIKTCIISFSMAMVFLFNGVFLWPLAMTNIYIVMALT